MKSFKLKNLLSLIGLMAILTSAIPVRAGSVPMSEVVQEINAKPVQSGGSATRLHLIGDEQTGGDETATTGQPVPASTPPQTRVYTVEEVDVIKDEDCNCVQPEKKKRKFPYWAFLGLAVVPFAFCCRGDDHKTPPKETPPMTPPHTPPNTPDTPTPPNTPVPEPMTLLLFGTGLAGVGLAARRRMRKNEAGDDKTEIQ